MLRHLTFVSIMFLILGTYAYGDGDPTRWHVSLQSSGETWVGAEPGCLDGYDGEIPFDVGAIPSQYLNLYLYRQEGLGWTGPTGFYGGDFESPISPGGSKTWWDLYLWTGNPSFSPSAYVTILPDGPLPPAGYWASLVLDHVPAPLNWTGPMEYVVSLDQRSILLLPVPQVSDGLQGTRMHLTVYAPDVPEPSSLSFLCLALAGAGIGVVRRRR